MDKPEVPPFLSPALSKHAADEEAFARLEELHRPRAYRFALGFLGDRTAAEDVVQEALTRLLEREDRFDHFGGYFMSVVSRLKLFLKIRS